MYPNQNIGGGAGYQENTGIGSGVHSTQPYPGDSYNPYVSSPQPGGAIGEGAASAPSYVEGAQPVGQGVGSSYPGNDYNAYNNGILNILFTQ
ncbi:hypothetical protein ANCCAN_04088 [Ancylostoma caninum]|uniref:Uncharacterized protein n=1 Tax=Ancylostoma caninum TaxID=29170 RepID=A0A368GZQ1_ANCCA|nr:hypothetical protein ANCCAN_04088 [Ancylostoma caninum]